MRDEHRREAVALPEREKIIVELVPGDFIERGEYDQLFFHRLVQGVSLHSGGFHFTDRDDVTQADKSIIIYNFRRWLTAKTIMPEAIKLLKVK